MHRWWSSGCFSPPVPPRPPPETPVRPPPLLRRRLRRPRLSPPPPAVARASGPVAAMGFSRRRPGGHRVARAWCARAGGRVHTRGLGARMAGLGSGQLQRGAGPGDPCTERGRPDHLQRGPWNDVAVGTGWRWAQPGKPDLRGIDRGNRRRGRPGLPARRSVPSLHASSRDVVSAAMFRHGRCGPVIEPPSPRWRPLVVR